MISGARAQDPAFITEPNCSASASQSLRRYAFLLLALLLLAAPVSARRHHRNVRHRTTKHQAKYRPAPAPVIEPVRNVVLLVAYGYDGGDWESVRASKPDGLTAWDKVPVTSVALAPVHTGIGPSALASVLSSGVSAAATDSLPPTLLECARKAGRSVALVGSNALTDTFPANLAVAPKQETNTDTFRRLLAARFDVLFARSAPADLVPAPASSGYRVLTEPQAILMAETSPVLATASAEAVPFDTLAFRALHLAAKNTKGFVMVVGATKPGATPADFNAAAATAINYSRRDKHTLVLVALCPTSGECTLYAEGMSAHKFGGTMMLADVPKVIAGVAAVPGIGRGFSPLYTPRLAPEPAAPRGKGIVPLPW